tara:strand:- start:55 stop:423 length:369 start_codon:yes stop_codon:yes gene_type:complete
MFSEDRGTETLMVRDMCVRQVQVQVSTTHFCFLITQTQNSSIAIIPKFITTLRNLSDDYANKTTPLRWKSSTLNCIPTIARFNIQVFLFICSQPLEALLKPTNTRPQTKHITSQTNEYKDSG